MPPPAERLSSLQVAPEIAFDLTPLQNAHRYRGIGTYVRGLASRIAMQSEIPIEFWAWDTEVTFNAPPPHTTLRTGRPPMPEYRGAWLFARYAMRRLSRQSRVRAVHVTDPDALTPLTGRRLLTTVYDLIPLKGGVARSRLLARRGYQTYLRNLAHVDILFAISEQTAGDLVELLRLPAQRIRLARPGVDVPAEGPRQVRRAQPYFLYIGGPNPNKNLSVLLDAMALCPELTEELRVGGRWLPKQIAGLEASVETGDLRGRVRHVGFVPPAELTALMRDATALVVPSLDEGFGLPVAEGLGAGALVIHSRLPVLEETSRGAALTFDPRSAAQLAECLRRAAGDKELVTRLRAEGQARAAKLTWDDAVQTTLATYKSVLAT